MLDLTCEFSENKTFRGLAYQNLPILDLTALPASQLRAAVDFISRHSARGVIYVHCKAGYSRSAAAVGAFLLATGQVKTVAQCLAMMRRARPSIVFRPEVTIALDNFCVSGIDVRQPRR